ncbi:putative FBD-associated F-box protein At1g61330 [Neltuma alba]|uniref:putative FBD-associated F-box protein At1g61330 n=1 Tax=Neltuma alba TaxID=207710 RepID=UPI0010A45975|nr:putative FBD-associated F-box protein At1g61330 [Prosopis alba]
MSRQPQKKIKIEIDETVHDDHLFSFLPIKEAVQVGPVSTRFKNAWHLNRMLLFGTEFARFDQQELVDLIERVFDVNKAPEIQAFCLHIDPQGVGAFIEKWLGICALKQVKELELQFSQPFLLESHFLDIQTLRILKLTNCEIQLPQVLTGLQFLNTIVFSRINLTENELKTLLSNCKLLNTLELSECLGIRVMDICARDSRYFKTLKIAYCPSVEDLNIDVPSLRSIFYRGAVIRIEFKKALPLKEAFFKFFPTRGYLLSHKVDRLVIDLFYATVLTTSSTFIELNNYNFECGLYWKLHEKPMLDNFAYEFSRLKFVKLIGFKFAEYEIELVKVLLQKSVKLESMVFVLPRNNRTTLVQAADATYYNHLFRSWTVSPTAKMFLYEHRNDQSKCPTHPKF